MISFRMKLSIYGRLLLVLETIINGTDEKDFARSFRYKYIVSGRAIKVDNNHRS